MFYKMLNKFLYVCVCVHIKKTQQLCKKGTRKQLESKLLCLNSTNPQITLKGQIALSKKRNVSYKINLI